MAEMTAAPPRYQIGEWVINGLVFIILVAAIASLTAPWAPERGWITIDPDSIRASWDADENVLDLSLLVTPHEACARIITAKTMRPVTNNDVVDAGEIIELRSHLDQKLHSIPVGQSEVRVDDEAVPTVPVPPGHYVMLLTAYCEPPRQPSDPGKQNGTATTTTPSAAPLLAVTVRALVIVPRTDRNAMLTWRRQAPAPTSSEGEP